MGKELRREKRRGWQTRGIGSKGVCFLHPFHPQKNNIKKKKTWSINPRNRFRLKVADSKLFLFAIRQLSSNVWDDTASILFIDYQQETLSMLTMCATYKSPCCCCCCCCFFLTSSPLPKKRWWGGDVNLKMKHPGKAVHQYSFMQNMHCQVEIETAMSAAFICHLPPGMLI